MKFHSLESHDLEMPISVCSWILWVDLACGAEWYHQATTHLEVKYNILSKPIEYQVLIFTIKYKIQTEAKATKLKNNLQVPTVLQWDFSRSLIKDIYMSS